MNEDVKEREPRPFMSRDFPTLRVPPAITEVVLAIAEAPVSSESMLELRRRPFAFVSGFENGSEVS